MLWKPYRFCGFVRKSAELQRVQGGLKKIAKDPYYVVWGVVLSCAILGSLGSCQAAKKTGVSLVSRFQLEIHEQMRPADLKKCGGQGIQAREGKGALGFFQVQLSRFGKFVLCAALSLASSI